MAEQTENYVNDTLDESSKIDSTPYLKIAEHGRSSRTKALKLKIDDVVVAVDGTEFRSTSENLVDLLSSEEDGKWLLTIFRDGQFFEIFTIGPLGGVLKFTSDEETHLISSKFAEILTKEIKLIPIPKERTNKKFPFNWNFVSLTII